MGTRADFYIGRTDRAEWLGSIAWDGYPEGIPYSIKHPQNEDDYRFAVTKLLSERDDATLPEHGWPWPWDDSATTDFAYSFDDGKVYASCFGSDWFDVRIENPDNAGGGKPNFPNMKERKDVNFGDRSGLIILG